MGLDEGEWIYGGGPDPVGAGAGAAGAGAGGSAGSVSAGAPLGGAVGRGRRGGGGIPGFSVRVVGVAVVAAVGGVVAAMLVVMGPSALAPASGPVPVGGGGPPGLSGDGDGRVRIVLTGRVLAISGRSITIGGNGPSVTAAVTGATRITGKAGGIGGVRVGDEVSARITGVNSTLTATRIQDPASM